MLDAVYLNISAMNIPQGFFFQATWSYWNQKNSLIGF